MIGQRLSHYRIIDQIGSGGMGVVYLAHDEHLDRDVAIKILFPGLLSDATARKQFRKEALSLARLNHPNIATVHEFGTQNGSDFLVTEHIAGTNLDALITRGPVSSDEVLRLGTQLAEGLDAAHQQGIVHRDLKPRNLRLTSDGRLKIIDFGIAQLLEQPTDFTSTETASEVQQISGTVPYMAPEQLRGEKTDTRSDIWSAGAVLYELATGKRPFVGSNTAVLINRIQNDAPVPPTQLNPALSPGLEQVILKTLEKDPAHRYQSASELGSDLKRLASPTATIPASAEAKTALAGARRCLVSCGSRGDDRRILSPSSEPYSGSRLIGGESPAHRCRAGLQESFRKARGVLAVDRALRDAYH
jgi:eukaryotic-like serine/threonine-protein kinase